MLNIIFTIKDIREWLTEEQALYFNSHFDFVSELPECIKLNNRIVYRGNIERIEDGENVIEMLTSLWWEPTIIGIWNNTWLQYWYKYYVDNTDPENPITTIIREVDDEWVELIINYPFNLTEYINYLADIKSGNPKIIEPHKCEEINWFSLEKLPKKLTQSTREPIKYYLNRKYIRLN